MANNQECLFKQWIAEHKGLMFKVVKTYAYSPQDKEGLFQEILLQLWLSIPGFKGNAKETTWVLAVRFL